MKFNHSTLAVSFVALFGSMVIDASAQNNPNYAPGDLILYFQQEGGTSTIYANLGDTATQFRGAFAGGGAPNKINFLDLNSVLSTAFGPNWASDPTIYAGLAGVWGVSSTTLNLQNGDPQRTLYVSRARDGIGIAGSGNSVIWDLSGGSNSAMTLGAGFMKNQNDAFENNYITPVAISPTSISLIDNQNPFFAPGLQGASFGLFDGGNQQVGTTGSIGSIGAAGNAEFALDLYRILSRSNDAGTITPNSGNAGVAGQVTGPLRVGTFEGTVVVNSSGMVSYISQGAAASPYTTWINSYPSISAPADQLPTADPDGDGQTNLAEFAFGGNPSSGSSQGIRQTQTVDANADSQRDLTLTLEVRSGASFTASGSEMVATVDGVNYQIQGSVDLVNFTSAVVEVTPQIGTGSPSAGYVFKTFRLVSGNGLPNKGFIRAAVTQ